MNKYDLVSTVKEIDSLLPMPDDPMSDIPVMFGNAGIIVMGDNGMPLLLGCYDDPTVMFSDESITPFAQGFGHLFFVHYGLLVDEETDDPEQELRPMRIIVGVTPEGVATSLFRSIMENEVCFVDENCEQTPNDPFLGMFG